MPPGSPALTSSAPALADAQLRKQLRRLVENTSVTTLRQGARLWGWPVKGTGKAALVDQIMGYLADEKRMRAAFQELSDQERTALSWLTALQLASDPTRPLQRALALSGLKLSQGAIRGLLQNLQARLLIFGDDDDGYDGPDLFREWLPALSVPGLQFPGSPPQARVMTLTEIDQHAHYLLSVVQGERPAAHLAPPARPPSHPHGKANPPSAARPSLVAPEVLERWGYPAGEPHHLARFLLEQLATAGFCTVASPQGQARLEVDSAALDVWHTGTPAQRVSLLRNLAIAPLPEGQHRLGSWTLLDLALDHVEGYTLRPLYAWAASELPTTPLFLLGLWLLSLTTRLEADTWYGIRRFQELLHTIQRDLLLDTFDYRTWYWHKGDQILDPDHMSKEVWIETYGRLVEAWLAGPASWLLLVEVGTLDGIPVAFRRPSAIATGEMPALPADALRFGADGTAVLHNSWQTGELRQLLGQIAVEVSRDLATTTYRLDSATWRRTLQSNLSPARLAEDFAVAGFPLPPSFRETLRLWQERSGRYQLYDNLAVVELGEDLLAEELQAVVERSGVGFYPASPRCLIILNPAQVPFLVEELRRRGHTPQVLP